MQLKALLACLFVCWTSPVSVVLARNLAIRGLEDWGYDDAAGVLGPNNWYKSYKLCAGSRQSPVDINPSRKIRLRTSLHMGGNRKVIGTLINNGHSPTFSVDKSAGTMTILRGRFQLEQFHFHFGCTDNVGSEHTVGGVSYPAEVHFVFFNSAKYRTIQEAQDKRDGLLVVGAFLDVDDLGLQYGNPELDKITRLFTNIKDADTSTPVEVPVDLTELVPPLEDDDDITLYMYQGSLTTPPCYESVKWMVLKETVPISLEQLENFRQLNSKHGRMCNNFRPTQPLTRQGVLELEFAKP